MDTQRTDDAENDQPDYHNVLDSPILPTQTAPMPVVHRRYLLILIIIVVAVGLYSFYAPVSVKSALHTDSLTSLSVEILQSDGTSVPAVFSSDTALSSLLEDASCKHIIQRDSNRSSGGLLIYPAVDSGYALYLSESESYVFSTEADKDRYTITDTDGALYRSVAALVA